MSWYAKIENSTVVEVTYLVDTLDSEWLYREFGGVWLKCAENGSLRNVFPSCGFTYNKDEDAFYPPKPFASWSFDRLQKRWVAPIDYPQDGKRYTWDETAQQWSLSEIA